MYSYQPLLNIDLNAIAKNWRYIQSISHGAEVSAVVKADAYGLGAIPIASELEKHGCRSFFVATLDEAIELSSELRKSSDIFVFDGYHKNFVGEYSHHNFIPVLNSIEQMHHWVDSIRSNRCAVMIDTGMNRLGLSTSQVLTALTKYAVKPRYFLSHLACADQPENPMNRQQLSTFSSLLKEVPRDYPLKISLSSSSGVFLGKSYCMDMVRPGIALYGSQTFAAENSPLINPVVELNAPIIQLRELEEDVPVGYGATETVAKGSLLATVRIGYADGIWRHLQGRLKGYIQGVAVSLVGRVSMDYCTFDLTPLKIQYPHFPVRVGDFLSILNNQQTIDDVAAMANTIPYEVLTSLGNRCRRIYASESAEGCL